MATRIAAVSFNKQDLTRICLEEERTGMQLLSAVSPARAPRNRSCGGWAGSRLAGATPIYLGFTPAGEGHVYVCVWRG